MSTASRVAYLRFLRRERRQSPRGEADADHVKVKTAMLRLRRIEKNAHWCAGDVDALIDGIGTTLTPLSSLPARCAPRGDLGTNDPRSGSPQMQHSASVNCEAAFVPGVAEWALAFISCGLTHH